MWYVVCGWGGDQHVSRDIQCKCQVTPDVTLMAEYGALAFVSLT